ALSLEPARRDRTRGIDDEQVDPRRLRGARRARHDREPRGVVLEREPERVALLALLAAVGQHGDGPRGRAAAVVDRDARPPRLPREAVVLAVREEEALGRGDDPGRADDAAVLNERIA